MSIEIPSPLAISGTRPEPPDGSDSVDANRKPCGPIGPSPGDIPPSSKELVDQAMEAGRGQMAAMVLHNIGNAITPIRVYLEQMRGRHFQQIAGYLEKCFQELQSHQSDLQHYLQETARGKEVFAYLGTLIEAVKKEEDRRALFVQKMEEGISYIAEILTLQKGYANSVKEPKSRVDLNALVEDALRLQAAALEKRQITVRKMLEPRLPPILIEKNRLMQALLNLIKNGCEAFDGISHCPAAHEIQIRTHSQEGHVHLEITDNGKGFTPESLSKVGTFGYSTKGSSGFGLYYCKMFVEAQDGTIDVRSEGPGKGATIAIRLPAAAGHP